MSDFAIRAVGLGKQYRIGERQRYRVLRDALASGIGALWRGRGADDADTIWALREVSFAIAPGDIVGIVGPNGAGKSTLLKLLTRITRPTTGYAEVRGRVGSLLEVGTGFNMELSGRDNIYLSGAILGMRKHEIDRKFDEIVAFSEVERFIDTPVKHYSNGMFVRIAFAVAAHLDPEILIIDEVLAVGDLAFQQKCLGKMGDVARHGRTVLFVSHNMGAVNALCRTAMRLDRGVLVQSGDVATVTEAYMTEQLARADPEAGVGYRVDTAVLAKQRWSDLVIERLEVCNPSRADALPATGDPLLVRIAYRAARAFVAPEFAVRIEDPYGNWLLVLDTSSGSGDALGALHPRGCVELRIDALPLVGGRYGLSLGFGRGRFSAAHLERVAEFHVWPRDVYGSGVPLQQPHGLVVAAHRWVHRAQA